MYGVDVCCCGVEGVCCGECVIEGMIFGVVVYRFQVCVGGVLVIDVVRVQ